MEQLDTLRPQFDRIEQRAFILGVVGGLALIAGALVSTHQFFQSYLYGDILWLGLTIGCLGILILHHLVSGHWGNLIQRIVESGARNTLLMGVLFIPVIVGMEHLYPWTNTAHVEGSHVLHAKSGYLNFTFFIVRAVLFFVVWAGIAFRLNAMSHKQDQTADPLLTRKMKIFSGPAMVLFVLTVSFASFDWMMSLEPEWYSTIYGMQTIVGGVLTTLAFCILMLKILSGKPPISEVITTRHIHHIGNLLMAFTILWAYMAFSQFLIIWSGNLPEDNFYYIRRLGTGWNIVAVILLVGHFFIPFLLLLSRKRKREMDSLARVAVAVFLMRLVDYFWLIVPAFSTDHIRVHPLDFAAPVAIGGLWVALFIRRLKVKPLLPLHDPRFEEGGESH